MRWVVTGQWECFGQWSDVGVTVRLMVHECAFAGSCLGKRCRLAAIEVEL
jgi:hypothetical protein